MSLASAIVLQDYKNLKDDVGFLQFYRFSMAETVGC